MSDKKAIQNIHMLCASSEQDNPWIALVLAHTMLDVFMCVPIELMAQASDISYLTFHSTKKMGSN